MVYDAENVDKFDNNHAFIVDGQIPNQVSRYVEITQIIDDTAIVKCIPGGGIAIRKLTDLFTSRYDAEMDIQARMHKLKTDYASEIEDVESLIRFLLRNNIHTNKIAREIAIKRANELGVDLQDIVN